MIIMPFGRFANMLLLEIPEEYYIWFKNKGFPKGELGAFMSLMLEIKTNGLEHLLVPLKKSGRFGKTPAVKQIY